MKRILFLLLTILIVFASPLSNLPVVAASEGYWELIKTIPTIPENTTGDDYKDTYSLSGTTLAHKQSICTHSSNQLTGDKDCYGEFFDCKANFSPLPTKINGGDKVSVNLNVIGTCSETNCYHFSGGASITIDEPEMASGFVSIYAIYFRNSKGAESYNVENIENTNYTDVFSAEMPNGKEDGAETSIYYKANYIQVEYRYVWKAAPKPTPSPTPTPEPTPEPTKEPTPSPSLNPEDGMLTICGKVYDLNGDNMPWMQIEGALVTEEVDIRRKLQSRLENYDSFKLYGTTITTRTNDTGYFEIKFPVPKDAEDVAVVLQGTLTCVGPDGKSVLFKLVDDGDSMSRRLKEMALSTWVDVSSDAKKRLKDGENVVLPQMLGFQNPLLYDSWAYPFSDTQAPYCLYLKDEDTGGKRIAHASGLYTATYDAWQYGGVKLKEQDTLSGTPVSIYLRSERAKSMKSSHFDSEDCTIHLTESDSYCDDTGLFTIHHEFGHAFDYITNGCNNFHFASNEGDNVVNHVGFMNDNMSDSYLEGFATAYAGLLRKDNKRYKDPSKLDFIDLSYPSFYTVYGNDGKNEEFAISTLLFQAGNRMKDDEFWGAIGHEYTEFKKYYEALDAIIDLDEYARRLCLFTIPIDGNGKYDEGEPYLDSNGNYQWDEGEPYADLGYKTEERDGKSYCTFLAPEGQEKAFNDAILSTAAEYDRGSSSEKPRKTVVRPVDGYMRLSGEEVEFVLVKIEPEGGQAYSALRYAGTGNVYLLEPNLYKSGNVTVSIPGGKTIYTTSIEDLNAAMDPTGAKPLANVYVEADALAPESVYATATFGDPEATGIMKTIEMKYEDFEDVILAEQRGEPVDSELPAKESSQSTHKDDGQSKLLLIILAIVLVVLGIVVLIIVVCGKKKKRSRENVSAQPYPQSAGPMTVSYQQGGQVVENRQPTGPVNNVYSDGISTYAPELKFCTDCGATLAPDMRFCPGCGKPVEQPKQPALKFCAYCGNPLEPDQPFCKHCLAPVSDEHKD